MQVIMGDGTPQAEVILKKIRKAEKSLTDPDIAKNGIKRGRLERRLARLRCDLEDLRCQIYGDPVQSGGGSDSFCA